jgi:hypothetical protein
MDKQRWSLGEGIQPHKRDPNQGFRKGLLTNPRTVGSIIVAYLRLFNAFQYILILFEGSLEVKLPTIWTDEKQSRDGAERRSEKRKIRREKIREEKDSEESRCRCVKR